VLLGNQKNCKELKLQETLLLSLQINLVILLLNLKSQGSAYEEHCLQGQDAMQFNSSSPTFSGNTVSICSWLRHYATSWKVADLSPDEVDFFNLPNPSGHIMALGLTQLAHKADLTAICEPTV
jgi:hypothetical protein